MKDGWNVVIEKSKKMGTKMNGGLNNVFPVITLSHYLEFSHKIMELVRIINPLLISK